MKKLAMFESTLHVHQGIRLSHDQESATVGFESFRIPLLAVPFRS